MVYLELSWTPELFSLELTQGDSQLIVESRTGPVKKYNLPENVHYVHSLFLEEGAFLGRNFP
jgi:hypothetical protein